MVNQNDIQVQFEGEDSSNAMPEDSNVEIPKPHKGSIKTVNHNVEQNIDEEEKSLLLPHNIDTDDDRVTGTRASYHKKA